MKRKILLLFLFWVLSFPLLSQNEVWKELMSFPYLSNRGYEVLRRICDESGGRLAGTIENEKALNILVEEGIKDSLSIRLEKFKMPGWIRSDDSVVLIFPQNRKLRAVALGFNDKSEVIATEVVYAKYGYEEDYEGLEVRGKIVLVTQERPRNKEELLRYEVIEIAARKGARAILFINNKPGGMVLAGVGNFQGLPNPIPAFSITYEEGSRLKRLIERGITPQIRLQSNSFCKPVESYNAIWTIEGKSRRKVVIGAHFDSWELGQGAIDNGVGVAVLYEIARNLRLIKNFDRTIEFVWFNGEELGLWGSKRYVEQHKDEVDLMINLDMPGTPRGFNAMGFDDLKGTLDTIIKNIDGFDLNQGVVSSPWTNSDHMYFMFEGIPCITLLGYMDEPMYRYYHDFSDSFDKVNKRYIADAAAIVSVLAYEFSEADRTITKLSRDEIKKILLNNHLDIRLRKQKEWKFD